MNNGILLKNPKKGTPQKISYVRTMAKRLLIERPMKKGPSKTAGHVPLTMCQCCTHRLGVKYVQAKSCPFRAANYPYTSSFPL